ncbi:hypothetical protein Tco_1180524 [Tanacetum coccineum]
MSRAKPRIMKMVWQTVNNHLDSGIFVMRHMKSFNGRKKDFNTGLKNEGNQQIKQLTGLRRKYLVKILMITINGKVSQVEEKAKKFNEYNDNQKNNFEKYTLKGLQPMVSKYYNENEEKSGKHGTFYRNSMLQTI